MAASEEPTAVFERLQEHAEAIGDDGLASACATARQSLSDKSEANE